ncbi:cupin domain [Rathayibacter sp. PhB151]|uniref:cupin domain-containing protein n=1 Tax=Rathayibacter sp. PhB151 TaxID=2485189 RepID=UPI001062E82A|nr:cupin domain-containing protein [Rathayibacter sp. PhB151]TDX82059.1 cupin domain [Rathayibacter sp. PhB151]
MQIQRLGEDARRRPLYGGSGVLDLEYYFRSTTALPSSVMRFHLEPGTSEGEHVHLSGDPGSCSPESSDELYVVVLGEVVMTVDGESAVLRAGDALYAPAGSHHGVANESDAPAELILVFGPPTQARS